MWNWPIVVAQALLCIKFVFNLWTLNLTESYFLTSDSEKDWNHDSLSIVLSVSMFLFKIMGKHRKFPGSYSQSHAIIWSVSLGLFLRWIFPPWENLRPKYGIGRYFILFSCQKAFFGYFFYLFSWITYLSFIFFIYWVPWTFFTFRHFFSVKLFIGGSKIIIDGIEDC